MAALLACITFPGGGVYPWVWIPIGCVTAALAWHWRSHIRTDDHVRRLDAMLTVAAAALLVQLVPMPGALVRAVAPHALDIRTSLWLTPSDEGRSIWLPISIIPADTVAAFGIFLSAALLFRTCRAVCNCGGTGGLVRAVAFIGLAASVAAIAQHAQDRELLYGIWRPLDAGARPYGPFVNRNHFASWVVMASPLVFGYLLARASSRHSSPALGQRVANTLKELGTMRSWLIASVCVMSLALLISTSRSGLVGLACAFTLMLVFGRQRFGPAGHRWATLQAVLLLMVCLTFANFASLMGRVDETLRPSGEGRGRSAIWADTRRMIRDFPLTGTGAGTFGSAITAYQTAEPGYSIGQAHNHYLQLAAEGGALVALPATLILISAIRTVRYRLRHPHDADFFVRAGAAAGVAAVLVQSIWETGLRMPANAMLLAVLAAIATHAPVTPLPTRGK